MGARRGKLTGSRTFLKRRFRRRCRSPWPNCPVCRDPDVFPEPHRLNLTRSASTNLMFGQGGHFCAGTAIAREEVGATLGAIVDEIDDLRPVGDLPPPIEGQYFRRPRVLHASIGWST